MNYKDLNIHQRINFKSWRLGIGPKIFRHDISESWNSDYASSARIFASEPAVVMKPRVLERYARKRGWF